MSYQNPNPQTTAQNGNFIKSLIKINNPDWNEAQIEAEFQKRMEALNNPNNEEGCDMCSG